MVLKRNILTLFSSFIYLILVFAGFLGMLYIYLAESNKRNIIACILIVGILIYLICAFFLMEKGVMNYFQKKSFYRYVAELAILFAVITGAFVSTFDIDVSIGIYSSIVILFTYCISRLLGGRTAGIISCIIGLFFSISLNNEITDTRIYIKVLTIIIPFALFLFINKILVDKFKDQAFTLGCFYVIFGLVSVAAFILNPLSLFMFVGCLFALFTTKETKDGCFFAKGIFFAAVSFLVYFGVVIALYLLAKEYILFPKFILNEDFTLIASPANAFDFIIDRVLAGLKNIIECFRYKSVLVVLMFFSALAGFFSLKKKNSSFSPMCLTFVGLFAYFVIFDDLNNNFYYLSILMPLISTYGIFNTLFENEYDIQNVVKISKKDNKLLETIRENTDNRNSGDESLPFVITKEAIATKEPKKVESSEIPKEDIATKEPKKVETPEIPKEDIATKEPKKVETPETPKEVIVTEKSKKAEITEIQKEALGSEQLKFEPVNNESFIDESINSESQTINSTNSEPVNDEPVNKIVKKRLLSKKRANNEEKSMKKVSKTNKRLQGASDVVVSLEKDPNVLFGDRIPVWSASAPVANVASDTSSNMQTEPASFNEAPASNAATFSMDSNSTNTELHFEPVKNSFSVPDDGFSVEEDGFSDGFINKDMRDPNPVKFSNPEVTISPENGSGIIDVGVSPNAVASEEMTTKNLDNSRFSNINDKEEELSNVINIPSNDKSEEEKNSELDSFVVSDDPNITLDKPEIKEDESLSINKEDAVNDNILEQNTIEKSVDNNESFEDEFGNYMDNTLENAMLDSSVDSTMANDAEIMLDTSLQEPPENIELEDVPEDDNNVVMTDDSDFEKTTVENVESVQNVEAAPIDTDLVSSSSTNDDNTNGASTNIEFSDETFANDESASDVYENTSSVEDESVYVESENDANANVSSVVDDSEFDSDTIDTSALDDAALDAFFDTGIDDGEEKQLDEFLDRTGMSGNIKRMQESAQEDIADVIEQEDSNEELRKAIPTEDLVVVENEAVPVNDNAFDEEIVDDKAYVDGSLDNEVYDGESFDDGYDNGNYYDSANDSDDEINEIKPIYENTNFASDTAETTANDSVSSVYDNYASTPYENTNDYSNEDFDNEAYSNDSYNDGYNNEAYSNDNYNDGYNNEAYSNDSFTNGYNDEYNNESYSSNEYEDENYNSEYNNTYGSESAENDYSSNEFYGTNDNANAYENEYNDSENYNAYTEEEINGPVNEFEENSYPSQSEYYGNSYMGTNDNNPYPSQSEYYGNSYSPNYSHPVNAPGQYYVPENNSMDEYAPVPTISGIERQYARRQGSVSGQTYDSTQNNNVNMTSSANSADTAVEYESRHEANTVAANVNTNINTNATANVNPNVIDNVNTNINTTVNDNESTNSINNRPGFAYSLDDVSQMNTQRFPEKNTEESYKKAEENLRKTAPRVHVESVDKKTTFGKRSYHKITLG